MNTIHRFNAALYTVSNDSSDCCIDFLPGSFLALACLNEGPWLELQLAKTRRRVRWNSWGNLNLGTRLEVLCSLYEYKSKLHLEMVWF